MSLPTVAMILYPQFNPIHFAMTYAVFSAEAGRRFEYYDGFVFQLSREGEADRPKDGHSIRPP